MGGRAHALHRVTRRATREDKYGTRGKSLNNRMAMIDEFLAILKRCVAREVEQQEAAVCDFKILN